MSYIALAHSHALVEQEQTTARERDAIGRTIMQLGASRLVVLGRVRFEQSNGRTTALWHRGPRRGSEVRTVGAVLAPTDRPER